MQQFSDLSSPSQEPERKVLSLCLKRLTASPLSQLGSRVAVLCRAPPNKGRDQRFGSAGGGRQQGPSQQHEHLDWVRSFFFFSRACSLTGSQKPVGCIRMLGTTPILVQKAWTPPRGSVPSYAFWQLWVVTREYRSHVHTAWELHFQLGVFFF